MLTPPAGLHHGDVGNALDRGWGVSVAWLAYRPVGFGSHHWVATDDLGLRHFVTVDELSAESRSGDEISIRGLHLRPALSAAADLRALGCGFVVAPMLTTSGDPLVQLGRYAVTLYPFIEGQGFTPEESFGPADREQVLEQVAVLHRVPLVAIRPPARDGFDVPWLDQLDLSTQPHAGSRGPHAAAASRLLIDNESAIRRLIVRYRTLVARYLEEPRPVVITHGEIHPGNVMVTSTGWVLVDWDTALVAPPERDLWRLAHGDASVLGAYAEATGTAPIEWILGLYETRWDLAEIASFAAQFREPHEDTEDNRKALAVLRTVVGGLPS